MPFFVTWDYPSFGSVIPEMKYAHVEEGDTAVYKFGFNNKEIDDETDLQDYGFRIYNPSMARFLSVDPISMKFPQLTPYQFASNTPVMAVDLDGLEAATVPAGTNNLIIVIQGAENRKKDVATENKTQVDNVNGGVRDNGLGAISLNSSAIASAVSVGESTMVYTYTSTHNSLTPDDIVTTIYNFHKANPTGTISLVGHSLGASNIETIINKLASYNINLDIVITLDAASNVTDGANNITVSTNVQRIFNFYCSPDIYGISGAQANWGTTLDENQMKTHTLINILTPYTHTNIDNSLLGLIPTLIVSFTSLPCGFDEQLFYTKVIVPYLNNTENVVANDGGGSSSINTFNDKPDNNGYQQINLKNNNIIHKWH